MVNRGLDWAPYPPTSFERCQKGTRTRIALLLALRPQGLTVSEALDLGIATTPQAVRDIMVSAEAFCGYDIRRKDHPITRSVHQTTYLLVGKHRWNGSYKAFRPIDDSLPNIRN